MGGCWRSARTYEINLQLRLVALWLPWVDRDAVETVFEIPPALFFAAFLLFFAFFVSVCHGTPRFYRPVRKKGQPNGLALIDAEKLITRKEWAGEIRRRDRRSRA